MARDTMEAPRDGASADRRTGTMHSVIWAQHILRLNGMPEAEIRAILTARDPDVVRRYLELHRERLQEQLDDHLRTLDVLETLLGSVTR